MRVWFCFALLANGFLEAEVRPVAMGPISVTVGDLDRSLAFYTTVLPFETESVREARLDSFDRLTGIFGTNVRVATLRLGAERIQLVEYVAPQGRAVPVQSKSNDGWFQHIAIVVSDMESAYARLHLRKVRQISTEPQTLPAWNQNAAGIKAFYFRDPDGHPLELIYFPPGKGDPRWQAQSTSKLFLGVDHTAIAVEDTEASLRFYRDVLGLRVAGESFNFGSEQDHLNHVYGSRVRITGLRGASGPGIEFLEYLAPRDSKAFPRDTQVNDLWNVHTTIFVDGLDAASAELGKNHAYPKTGAVDARPLVNGTGFLVRDPDGHGLLVGARDH